MRKLNIFELVAKIRLDSGEYEQGIDKARGSFSKLASGVGKGLATVAKIGMAAVSAGVAGVTALTKMGIEGYAQYEQLVGGVETLFKDSQGVVMAYATNAYKTSGMSANKYMETVTSFSASLIQSLGGDTAKAAEIGDMAITDMSDNANKMGTSIEMIQNAYAGFAKGNFTMLDNLKLGYGGTQQEMKRLLKDAQAISGIKYDISSFADISEAIHVIQTDLEISGLSYEEAMAKVASGELTMDEAIKKMGTTAREATETISGSLSMMKGAWENLVVGIANKDADLSLLINNFVESTSIAAKNLVPVIKDSLAGIGQLITEMAPIISEALPVLVESLLPAIITAGISLITALANAIVQALPAVKDALLNGLVIILTDVFGVSKKEAWGFAKGLNEAFYNIADGFKAMVEMAQTDGTWLNSIWEGLKGTGKAFCDFCVALWDALSAAFTWMVEQANTEGTRLNTIWENIKTFISAAIQFIQGIIQLFTAVLRGDWSAAWEACKSIASSVWSAIGSIVSSIVELITGFLGTMVEKGFELINYLAEGIQNKFAELLTLVGGWVTDNIINPIADMGGDLYDAGAELLNQLWDGMKSIWDSIARWWDGLSFSKKSANVDINTNGATPHATGLNYVPYDGYAAILHRGEAVLTAAEARIWRRDGFGGATPAMAGGITINQYIQSVPQSPVDLANTTEAYFEQARWML
jgi:phage-related protein